MIIKLTHGIPTSPFFIIAQPVREYKEPRFYQPEKTVVELTDPKSKCLNRAEAEALWTFEKNDVVNVNAFCKLAYGVDGKELYNIMLAKYSEMKDGDPIEFWLLKRL